ncbi:MULTISPECIES: hypothetical protein [unclassified Micromonospora]|uniref:hypothetical protein n=1 Tax=unclassified Micromonospora TaxID=2617518 RepID=UPI003A85D866
MSLVVHWSPPLLKIGVAAPNPSIVWCDEPVLTVMSASRPSTVGGQDARSGHCGECCRRAGFARGSDFQHCRCRPLAIDAHRSNALFGGQSTPDGLSVPYGIRG